MRVLASAIMFVVMAVGISGQSAQKPKKFLTAPLTIEDQGSFFIGGVQKVTYQAAPTPPNQPLAPHQITIGQMYVQFQIPAKKYGGWPVIMVHGSTHTAACLESTPGRPRRLVSVLRPQGRPQLRRRSGRPRPLGLRRVRDSRGRGQIVAGDPKGRRHDPGFRPDHRRRRVDQLVRPPRPGELHHPDRHADPAWRSGRSEPASGRLRARRAAVPDRFGGCADRLARRRHRARAGRSAGNLRARVLQAAGAERRGHAAGLDLQHLRPEGDRARQHLDAAESGVAGRAARRRRSSSRTRSRGSWDITWPASSKSAAISVC